MASASTSKTSDTLLSSFLSPPFTLSSFASALADFDTSTHPALVAQREAIEAKEESYELKFPKWRYELSQGYSILLYGFGSKQRVVQAFADEARKRGNVVIVNGFDASVVGRSSPARARAAECPVARAQLATATAAAQKSAE